MAIGDIFQPTTTTLPAASNVLGGTQLPEWVSQAGQDIFASSSALANTPYQMYDQNRMADFNQDQQGAFEGVRGTAGTWSPYLADAATSANNAFFGASEGATPWSQDAADQYMNPYQQNVTDIVTREMNRQFDQQRIAEAASAVNAGAFGGNRHGLVEAENERNRNFALGDVIARGQYDAYNNAQSMFGADKTRQLQSANLQGDLANQYAQLGSTRQALGLQDAQALQEIGQQQQDLEQQGLGLAYEDFQRQQQYPYEQLNWLTGALSGVPYNQQTFKNTSGYTTGQGASALGQVGGALAGLVGGYNLLNKP